jgi:hypothetical protein
MDDHTSDRTPSLTSHAARRRRTPAGVIAGAALAVPGMAFAAGSGGAPGGSGGATSQEQTAL